MVVVVLVIRRAVVGFEAGVPSNLDSCDGSLGWIILKQIVSVSVLSKG